MIYPSAHLRSVKEALDHLPCGICFFDEKGHLVLCNQRMYELCFALMSHDLQSLWELDQAILSPPEISGITLEAGLHIFPDHTSIQFTRRTLHDSEGHQCTEYMASDVTELYRKRQELRQQNQERQTLLARLRRISQNLVSVTRQEEILELKMKIHNSLGCCVQDSRRFLSCGCPVEELSSYLSQQRQIASALRGELEEDESVDPLRELQETARKLHMELKIYGSLPKNQDLRDLVAAAARECLTNTVRHAGGDRVDIKLRAEDSCLTVVLQNNGTPPNRPVIEGGGLGSLRLQTLRIGGTMEIRSSPRFVLTLTLPTEGGITT